MNGKLNIGDIFYLVIMLLCRKLSLLKMTNEIRTGKTIMDIHSGLYFRTNKFDIIISVFFLFFYFFTFLFYFFKN